jgi:hypothetical protein
MYLEGVFTAEALVAPTTWKGLDGEVNALVPLQIVVTVKVLRAHIAFEGPVMRCLAGLARSIHLVHLCRRLTAVEGRWTVRHARDAWDERHGAGCANHWWRRDAK